MEERKVEVRYFRGKIWIRSNFYLGDLYFSIKDFLFYDRTNKVFYSYPFYLEKIVNHFENNSVKVENFVNVKENRIEGLEFKGKLRDYQEEALREWEQKGRRGIISLPTGAGKTHIAIAAITSTSVETLIVVVTKEQMFQFKEKVLELTNLDEGKVGFFYGSKKELKSITIATYQAAYKYLDVLSRKYPLLIVDEVHHLPANSFRKIGLGMFSKYRLGLSATVEREDGKHFELFNYIGSIIYYKSINELINKGYVANYETSTIYVNLTKEEKEKFKELLIKYKALKNGLSFKELLENAKRGNEKAIEALRINSEIRKLLNVSKSKISKAIEIIENEVKKGSKVIAFCQYVDQAKEIAKKVNGLLISGETKKEDRERAFDAFRKMRSGALIITTVGDEGIDIPDANVGVIVSGTGSRRQYIQRLGRLLRPVDGKTAKLLEIIVKGTSEVYQAQKRKSVSIEQLINDDLLSNK